MNKIIIIQEGIKPGICGVYKILFDDSFFYIGSSVDIYYRARTWKSKLKMGMVNKKMASIVQSSNKIEFSILEICDKDAVKQSEDIHIKNNFENDLLLNRASNAWGGAKWSVEELAARNCRTKKLPNLRSIGLVRTKGEWDLIKKRLEERGRKDISSYILSETNRIIKTFEECPNCITAGDGIKKTMRPYLQAKTIEDLKKIAALMDKSVSSVINDLIICPLLYSDATV